MYKILKKEKLNDAVTSFTVSAPLVAAKVKAGQFVIIRIDEEGERIPLTVSDFDRTNGTVTLVVQAVGYTTKKLALMNEGDYISDVVGPLGLPTEFGTPKKAVVIGGGVGCAIAFPQAKTLHDMGVEVDFEKLPGIQKSFIRRCYQAGKIVITATQMLESMVTNLMPTRAEISDVANAVFDGTSAVMLSGETAMGVNPPHVVEVMAKIAKQAESDAIRMGAYKGIIEFDDDEDTTNAICDAACTTAQDLKARAIIAVTKSGYTARRVSKFRPRQAIVASTPVRKTYHQLAMSWGVLPVLSLNQTDTDSLFQHAIDCAKQVDVVRVGDRVVITAGVPLGRSGTTNILKVETVEGTR